MIEHYKDIPSLSGMKIVITAHELESNEHRGISAFTKSLIKVLNDHGSEVWLLTEFFPSKQSRQLTNIKSDFIYLSYLLDFLAKGYKFETKIQNNLLSFLPLLNIISKWKVKIKHYILSIRLRVYPRRKLLYLNNNQFSEEIPSEINGLISLERLQLHNNQLSGLVSETICELNVEFDSSSRFNISNNLLCPPYPNCIENYVGEQDTTECSELSSNYDTIEYRLNNPYPNPFNPTTTIEYNVPNFSNININIYNINGQLIEVLTNKMHQPGIYNINWHAQEYTSGVYFVKLIAGEFVDTQKMMLIK